MNWEAIGAVSEALGAVAVFITLVYLALQIRHNSAVLEAQSEDAIATGFMNLNAVVAGNSELGRVFVQGCEDYATLNADERIQFNFHPPRVRIALPSNVRTVSAGRTAAAALGLLRSRGRTALRDLGWQRVAVERNQSSVPGILERDRPLRGRACVQPTVMPTICCLLATVRPNPPLPAPSRRARWRAVQANAQFPTAEQR